VSQIIPSSLRVACGSGCCAARSASGSVRGDQVTSHDFVWGGSDAGDLVVERDAEPRRARGQEIGQSTARAAAEVCGDLLRADERKQQRSILSADLRAGRAQPWQVQRVLGGIAERPQAMDGLAQGRDPEARHREIVDTELNLDH
jgi:hypothetical protein